MDDILKKISEMRPPLRLCSIQKTEDATCGFHLSRTQWDPYPWISNVEEGSPAASAGLMIGDFVIEVNGQDILGLRIDEVAQKVRLKSDAVRLLVWKSTISETENKLSAAFNLQKFSGFLQSTLQLIECPVCLDITSVPTFQCVNGHILCSCCRQKTSKCPMCRVTLSGKGRCLLAEKLHRLVRKTLAVKCPESNQFKEVPTTELVGEQWTARRETAEYCCPWNASCAEKLTGDKGVLNHLHVDHGGPYVQYVVHGDSLTLQLPRTPFAAGITAQHSHLFFLRVSEAGSCWVSVLGDSETAAQYVFTIEDSPPFPVSSLRDEAQTTFQHNAYFQLPPNSNDVRISITSNKVKES